MMGRHISSLYFDYRPVGRHQAGCAAAASNRWEVTEYTWAPSWSSKTEYTIRLACPECGNAVFFAWKEDDNAEEVPVKREQVSAKYIGYGSKPERCAGLWLHAGPSLGYGVDKDGPTAYYLTTTKEQPRTPEDVAGIVGWKTGPRGGIRWVAGVGCTDRGTMGCTDRGSAGRIADHDFGSRPAAVKWVAAELAAAAGKAAADA